MLKTKAIVLSSMKYGESSLILQMYTREEGRASFIIGGVRKTKARVSASLFQPGHINEVVAYYKPGDRLNRIKEIKPCIIYQHIPFKMHKRAVTLFTSELLIKLILEHDANPALFDFLFHYFSTLDKTENSISNFPVFIMRELSIFHGFGPNNNYSDSKNIFNLIDGLFDSNIPKHRHYIKSSLNNKFHLLLNTQLDNIHQLELTRPERTEILNIFIDYYKIHIDGFQGLNSQQIFSEVFG